LYYLIKANESAGQFASLCKGHANNFFLGVDFLGNVGFAYLIIPMAVQVVLDSDGLDIVLNLIALDFVTEIDEELFDESVKSRCQGPYIFVFRLRDLPTRFLGIKNVGKGTEPTLVCDVYNKQKINEILDDGNSHETEYWVRDPDLSQWQATIDTEGEHIKQISQLMESSKWNTRIVSRAPHSLSAARKRGRTINRDQSLL